MPLGLATIAFKLLGIGKAIGGAVKGVVRWGLSDIRHIAIIALVVAVGVLWLQSGKWQGRAEKALAAVEQRDKTIAQMNAASEAARAAQIAMNAKRTQDEKDIANDADKNIKIAQGNANHALADYVSRNRVQNCPADSSGTNPAAENSSAEIPAEMPTGAVMVSEGDLQADSGAISYAIEAHNWIADLIAKGLAVETE